MMEFISAHPFSFWLSLGGLLLAAEMLGAAGYLLWSGIAAVCTALISWFIPDAWAWQGGIFALLIVITAWLWWLCSHRSQQREGSQLNQRKQQLIGRCFYLEMPLINGRGHIRIGDGSWPAQAGCDLPAGTQIQITAVKGITLYVQPCPGQPSSEKQQPAT